ncbi:hypothetical protein VUR80DRAFT_1421 [Thermomyces stellatus]
MSERDGKAVGDCRKRHLCKTDETWASEGNSATVGAAPCLHGAGGGSFDGMVLRLFTPSGEHPGSNALSARSARSELFPLWTRGTLL